MEKISINSKNELKNGKTIHALIEEIVAAIQMTHGHVVAFKEDGIDASETRKRVRFEGIDSQGAVCLVNEDISLFLPEDEDDFLLFFPSNVPEVIPSWPQLIEEMNAVHVNMVDEFITIFTIDPRVVEHIKQGVRGG